MRGGDVPLLEGGETAADPASTSSTSTSTSSSGQPALVLQLSGDPMELRMEDLQFMLLLLQTVLLSYVVLKEAGS